MMPKSLDLPRSVDVEVYSRLPNGDEERLTVYEIRQSLDSDFRPVVTVIVNPPMSTTVDTEGGK